MDQPASGADAHVSAVGRAWTHLSQWLEQARTQDVKGKGRLQRFVAHNLQVLLLVGRWDVITRLQLHAQALTYDSLLALVPMLAVVFAAVSGFGGLEDVRQRLEVVIIDNISGSPEVRAAVGDYIRRFLGNIRTGSFSAISIIILIFSVTSLLGHIEFAFNTVFGVKTQRPWATRFLMYWAALTLGPLLLGASFGLTAAFQNSQVADFISSLGLGAILLHALPITVTWVAFTAMYKVVPSVRVRPSAAIFAALVAGSLWSLAKYLYAIYAKNALTMQNIYGSLAAVPLFILWIYFSWLVVLFGAQIAFAYQHARTYNRDSLSVTPSQSYRERIACRLFFEVARDFFVGRPPTDPDRVANDLGIPRRLLEGIVADLVQGNFLRIVGEDEGLLPARDLEHVSIADILRFMRSGLGEQLAMKQDEPKQQLEAILDDVDRAGEARGSVACFRELVERAAATSPATAGVPAPGPDTLAS